MPKNTLLVLTMLAGPLQVFSFSEGGSFLGGEELYFILFWKGSFWGAPFWGEISISYFFSLQGLFFCFLEGVFLGGCLF